jgi:hypothetical protein
MQQTWDDGNAYKILDGKTEAKGPLGRPRYRWEDNNIKIYLEEVECWDWNWIHLSQNGMQWRAL